jgi:hypothetical protein
MDEEEPEIPVPPVRESADAAGLFTALLDQFAMLGGVDLELPGREEPARAANFDGTAGT